MRSTTTHQTSYRVQQAPPSTSFVDNTIDLPWRNFLNLEFGTNRTKVPLLMELPKYPYNAMSVGEVERSLRAENWPDLSDRLDTIPACDGRTDTDGRK